VERRPEKKLISQTWVGPIVTRVYVLTRRSACIRYCPLFGQVSAASSNEASSPARAWSNQVAGDESSHTSEACMAPIQRRAVTVHGCVSKATRPPTSRCRLTNERWWPRTPRSYSSFITRLKNMCLWWFVGAVVGEKGVLFLQQLHTKRRSPLVGRKCRPPLILLSTAP
jgi:hypothetical protein